MNFNQAPRNDETETNDCDIFFEKKLITQVLDAQLSKNRNHFAHLKKILESSNEFE
jgi:hypothetical protein